MVMLLLNFYLNGFLRRAAKKTMGAFSYIFSKEISSLRMLAAENGLS
jgi:hypothetical protein